MEINLFGPYKEYEAYIKLLTSDSYKKLSEEADNIRPKWDLKIGEFFRCCAGDFSLVIEKEQPKVWQVLWVEDFVSFVEQFTDVLKRLTLEPTKEQKQASNGCLPMEWQESILIFVRSYFGLQPFEAAESIRVSDFILAKKHDYNTTLSERNMNAISLQKLKRK